MTMSDPRSVTVVPGLELTPEFTEAVRKFREELTRQAKEISNRATDQVDGKGREVIQRRPDGYDYIEGDYLVYRLDMHFPGWSWELAAPPQVLGVEWIVSSGTLTIIVPELLPWGIVPPVRRFYGQAGKRVGHQGAQKDKKGNITAPAPPHSAETIIDLKNDLEAANTNALKVAINRLTHICDDIYGRRIDSEGMGTYEGLFESNPTAATFNWMLKNKLHMSMGDALRALQKENATQIEDYHVAYEQLRALKAAE